MAVPGNIGDIITTTLRNRTGELADNVTRNNAILRELSKRAQGFMPVGGGRTIDQEIAYSNNLNGTWYSGYETVSIAPQETFTMAEFDLKLLVAAVSISGQDMLMNSDEERSINLVASRVQNAESTLKNMISLGMYSDGTAFGGKIIGGLQLLVADTPTNTVGGISRSSWPFWANVQSGSTNFSATTIQAAMDNMVVQLMRGNDGPQIILCDNVAYSGYMQSMQTIQRVTDPDWASAGFKNLAYLSNIPVILDGGYQGANQTVPTGQPPTGGCPASHMYFLNTDYIHYRPHKDRNLVPLDPENRYSTNQDAVIKLVGWAGNMTISNSFLQGVLH